MTLNLRERIILGRITSIDNLSAVDRLAIEDDLELQKLLEENAKFIGSTSNYPEAPEKWSMLDRIRANVSKDRKKESGPMFFIQSLLSGKRLHLQVAIVLFVAVAFIGAAMTLTSEKSYAATDGIVLEVDLGMIPVDADGKCDQTALDTALKNIQFELQNWIDGNKTETPVEIKQKKIIAAVKIEKGHAVMRIGVLNEDSSKLESLKQMLIDKGYSVLTISDATWFECTNKDATMDGLTIDIGSHIFSFPKDASEEEIEKTINDWFVVNQPDKKVTVDVIVTEENGNRRIKIKLFFDKEGETD